MLAGVSLDVEGLCSWQGLLGHKVHVAGNASDYHQLLRHLGEASLKLPTWRQQRPSLLVEAAEFHSNGPEGSGTLVLRYCCLLLQGFVLDFVSVCSGS